MKADRLLRQMKADRLLRSGVNIHGRSMSYQGSAIMLSPGGCFAAFLLSVTVIAASTGADAQEHRRLAPPAPAARPAGPPSIGRPAPAPAKDTPSPPPAKG